MHLQFLGTSGGFSKHYTLPGDDLSDGRVRCNWHSNMLLWRTPHKRLLIDAGFDINNSMQQWQVPYGDIRALYITHAHGDHVAGVEPIMYSLHAVRPGVRHSLFAHPDVWQEMRGMFPSLRYFNPNGHSDLSEFFSYRPATEHFLWEGFSCTLVKRRHVIHTPTGTAMPCYGLIITDTTVRNSETIFISADGASGKGDRAIIERASAAFMDFDPSKPHASVHGRESDYDQYPSAQKQKVYAYHYDPIAPLHFDLEQKGFAGYAKAGAIYSFNQ